MICKNCTEQAHTKGLCRKCYHKATYTPKPLPRKNTGLCVNGCGVKSYCKEMCRPCYQKEKYIPKPRKAKGKVCTIEGCEKEVQAKGLCNAHYQKQRSKENVVNGGGKNAPHYLTRIRQQLNDLELGRIKEPIECLKRINSILSIYENL